MGGRAQAKQYEALPYGGVQTLYDNKLSAGNILQHIFDETDKIYFPRAPIQAHLARLSTKSEL